MNIKAYLYRSLMRFAHRHGWHHIRTIQLANGDVQSWCQWCGLRETLKSGNSSCGRDIITGDPRIILTSLKPPTRHV